MTRSDYITVETWNTKLQKVEYHYVHKSIKNPKQYVLSLYPEERLLQSLSNPKYTPQLLHSNHGVTVTIR